MTGPAPLVVLDERSRPSLRERVGALLATSDEAAFAVTRIRLAVLDLSDRELGRLRRCRVLLGHLDASMLMDAAEEPGAGGDGATARLLRFATSGRLEVRSAGLAAWTPDFAVVSGAEGRIGVLGSIQFGNPELLMGPAFTVVTPDPDCNDRLLARFDELWARSHDVLPAIREVLERAEEMGDPAAVGGGRPHPA